DPRLSVRRLGRLSLAPPLRRIAQRPRDSDLAAGTEGKACLHFFRSPPRTARATGSRRGLALVAGKSAGRDRAASGDAGSAELHCFLRGKTATFRRPAVAVRRDR